PQEQDFQAHSYLEVIEALLRAGADPNKKNGSQPFYLFYSGCGNPNCGPTNHANITPSSRAALGADAGAMRLLVRYGADPCLARGAPTSAAGGGRGAGPANAAQPQVPAFPATAIHAASGLGFGQGVGAGNANRFLQNGW